MSSNAHRRAKKRKTKKASNSRLKALYQKGYSDGINGYTNKYPFNYTSSDEATRHYRLGYFDGVTKHMEK